MPSTHTTPISPGKWLQTQRLVHMGLVLGLGASIVFLNMDNIPDVDFQSLDYLFPYGVPVLAAAGILLGAFLFRRQMVPLRKAGELDNKLNGYGTASLIRWGLVEGPAFLANIAAGNEGNAAYLILAVVLLLYIVTLAPTRQRVLNDLQLNPEQQRAFEADFKN
ncbi:hypothetical protein OZ410_06745 [Robiginitalea sp. M366]|uniref:hypothetical protein n=1 Tax=Robiginitalea aestuariiviva TaxID=3036903 RepID=UPI00240E4A88|nr:hypothetical protein [Robiginitalea aestuariiviva]MDG1572007.1 hypothetical protein [Robiginitalea aestuariiviva]